MNANPFGTTKRDARAKLFDHQWVAGGTRWRDKPLTDWPVVVEPADYQAEEDRFADAVIALSDQISVYNFGVAGTPGISDIDILCVVPDDIAGGVLDAIGRIPKSFLFVHGPIILSSTAFRHVRWLLPISTERSLKGPAMAASPLTPDSVDAQNIALLEGFEGAVARWKGLQCARGAEHFPVRRSMLALWSARHSITCARQAGIVPRTEWQTFSDRCVDLRMQWSHDRTLDVTQLAETMESAPGVIAGLVDALGDACIGQLGRDPPPRAFLSLGRSVVRGVAETDAWRYHALEVRYRSRGMVYHAVDLPHRIVSLLAETWAGDSAIERCARRRSNLALDRARMARHHSGTGIAGAPSLFEPRPSAFWRRMLDANIRRRLIRGSFGD